MENRSEQSESPAELARRLEDADREREEDEDPGGPPPEELDEDPSRDPDSMKRLQGG